MSIKITKKALQWRKVHLENLIWAANKKGVSMWTKKDIPRFKKELKLIKQQLK